MEDLKHHDQEGKLSKLDEAFIKDVEGKNHCTLRYLKKWII